jgi:hypothetical protein
VKGESACNQGTINKEYDAVISYLNTVGYRMTTTVSHTTTKVGRKEIYKRPLYWVPGTWTHFTRSMIDKPRAKYKNPIRVEADFDRAEYENKGRELGVDYYEKRPLIHGFNLYNLLRLGYAMPSPERIVSLLKTMTVIGHCEYRDLRPWNMILGRTGISLIDERPNGLKEGWDKQMARCVKGIQDGITDPWWFHGREQKHPHPKYNHRQRYGEKKSTLVLFFHQFPLRYWVKSTLMTRVAAAQPIQTNPAAPQYAVALKRADSIARATRMKTTAHPEKRGNPTLISPDPPDGESSGKADLTLEFSLNLHQLPLRIFG